MAINFQYSGDPLLMAEVARMAGQGQFAQAQDQFRAGQDQFHLNLGQRAREFDESTRQFDVTQKEGVRRFDQTYDLNRDQFGEQQRQADIENQRSDFQFGSKLDFDYDQMAQQQYAREQEMAFQAQQQQERQAAAMAAQQQQQQHARWQTYQGIESQQFAVHAKQAEAELKKLGEHKFRTPELKEAAYAQWQERYGSYMPAPIDFGPPPEQQDPWDSIPTREIPLPNGQTVTGYLKQDRNGNWSLDTGIADVQASIWDKQVDNEAKAAQSQQTIQQKEAEFKLAQETAELNKQNVEHDNIIAAQGKQMDLWSLQATAIQKQQDALKAAARKNAELIAGKKKNANGEEVQQPIDIPKLEAEFKRIDEAYPLPPMPQVGTASAPETSSPGGLVGTIAPSSPAELRSLMQQLKESGKSGQWVTVVKPDGSETQVQVP